MAQKTWQRLWNSSPHQPLVPSIRREQYRDLCTHRHSHRCLPLATSLKRQKLLKSVLVLNNSLSLSLSFFLSLFLLNPDSLVFVKGLYVNARSWDPPPAHGDSTRLLFILHMRKPRPGKTSCCLSLPLRPHVQRNLGYRTNLPFCSIKVHLWLHALYKKGLCLEEFKRSCKNYLKECFLPSFAFYLHLEIRF